jgi:Sap, sulfolipid-1-addressing protein
MVKVSLAILPLAVTMMAGPQIMSAFVFVTAKRPVQLSLSFLGGVALGTTLGLTIARGITALLHGSLLSDDTSDSGFTAIQIALVGLLLALAVKSYLGRETAEPPSWLAGLLGAGPRRAFTMGLLLILLMPSDVVIMLTVATNLEQNDASIVAATPFVVATIAIAALPFLAYVLFHRAAQRAMPRVRDWMTSNSWLVNIVVYCIFIVLILAS